MIPMKMGNEDMVYLIEFDFKTVKLDLSALSAIYQIKLMVYIQQLR
jgi:hypothetical protein